VGSSCQRVASLWTWGIQDNRERICCLSW